MLARSLGPLLLGVLALTTPGLAQSTPAAPEPPPVLPPAPLAPPGAAPVDPASLTDRPEVPYPPSSSVPTPLPAAPRHEPLEAWSRRPLALRARLGLGAPWGLVGASVDVAPVPYLSIEAGVGQGIFGTNLDVMGHVRVHGGRSWAWSLGAGASTGRHAPWGAGPGAATPKGRTWERAFWGNVQLAFEKRFESGVTLGVQAGLGTILNRSSGSTCRDCDQVYTLPYAGTSLGYAFAL